MDDEQRTIPAQIAAGRGRPAMSPATRQAIADASVAAGFPPPPAATAATPSTPPGNSGEQDPES